MSPWRLPGEPNDGPRIGLQPVTDPLLAADNSLFSRSTLILNITYSTENPKMQGYFRTILPVRPRGRRFAGAGENGARGPDARRKIAAGQ